MLFILVSETNFIYSLITGVENLNLNFMLARASTNSRGYSEIGLQLNLLYSLLKGLFIL